MTATQSILGSEKSWGCSRSDAALTQLLPGTELCPAPQADGLVDELLDSRDRSRAMERSLAPEHNEFSDGKHIGALLKCQRVKELLEKWCHSTCSDPSGCVFSPSFSFPCQFSIVFSHNSPNFPQGWWSTWPTHRLCLQLRPRTVSAETQQGHSTSVAHCVTDPSCRAC